MVDTNNSNNLQPIPHSKGLPLVGHTLQFIQSPHHYIQAQQQKHGGRQCPVFSSSLLGQKVHVVCSESGRQQIEQNAVTYTHNKAYELIGFQRFYGPTVLTSDDPAYVQQVREVFGEAFGEECMSNYVMPIVTQYCHTVIAKLITDIAHSDTPTPLYAALKEIVPTLIFQLVLSSSIATEHDDLRVMLDNHTLHKWSSQTFQGSIALPLKWLPLNIKSSFAQGQDAKQEFQQWLRQRIGERLPAANELTDSHTSLTFFDRLLLQIHRMSKQSSDEHALIETVVNHMTLFISALVGKAVTSLITTTIEQLWSSPDSEQYVSQIRDEVPTSDMRELTYELLQRMEILDNVMREVQRLYPPILGVPRYSQSNAQAPTLTHTHTQHSIPDSSHIWLSYYAAGHDTTCYDNAEHFDPSRWKVDCKTPGQLDCSGHHLAFGSGSRSCLGQAFSLLMVKAVVLQLITSADWRVVDDGKPRSYKYIPVYRAVNDLPVTCNLHERRA